MSVGGHLYYGIGQPADPPKARLCAYLERSSGETPVFGGSAILMMIYSTGTGARRNPDLAIRFADQRLNAVHQQVMKGPESPDFGTVTTPDIRKTERTWPAYRDAWADYASVKFPRSDSRGIKIWLTRERAEMLKEFVPRDGSRGSK